MSSMLSILPDDIFRYLIHKWIDDVKDIVSLDTALCQQSLRNQYVLLLPQIDSTSINVNFNLWDYQTWKKFSKWSHVRKISIGSCMIDTIPYCTWYNFSSLEKLTICRPTHEIGLRNIVGNFPNLTFLGLKESKMMVNNAAVFSSTSRRQPNNVPPLLEGFNMKNLTHFQFENGELSNLAMLLLCKNSFTTLQSIKLIKCRRISDTTLYYFSKHLIHLTTLHIENSSHITNEGIKTHYLQTMLDASSFLPSEMILIEKLTCSGYAHHFPVSEWIQSVIDQCYGTRYTMGKLIYLNDDFQNLDTFAVNVACDYVKMTPSGVMTNHHSTRRSSNSSSSSLSETTASVGTSTIATRGGGRDGGGRDAHTTTQDGWRLLQPPDGPVGEEGEEEEEAEDEVLDNEEDNEGEEVGAGGVDNNDRESVQSDAEDEDELWLGSPLPIPPPPPPLPMLRSTSSTSSTMTTTTIHPRSYQATQNVITTLFDLSHPTTVCLLPCSLLLTMLTTPLQSTTTATTIPVLTRMSELTIRIPTISLDILYTMNGWEYDEEDEEEEAADGVEEEKEDIVGGHDDIEYDDSDSSTNTSSSSSCSDENIHEYDQLIPPIRLPKDPFLITKDDVQHHDVSGKGYQPLTRYNEEEESSEKDNRNRKQNNNEEEAEWYVWLLSSPSSSWKSLTNITTLASHITFQHCAALQRLTIHGSMTYWEMIHLLQDCTKQRQFQELSIPQPLLCHPKERKKVSGYLQHLIRYYDMHYHVTILATM